MSTRDQSIVGSVLESLGCEFIKPEDNKVGGDQQYTTDKVAETVEGKTIVLKGDGSIELK